jgi:glutamate dehydrogenase (NAD(P)+)
VTERLLTAHDRRVQGASVAIQGFGNVGRYAAIELARRGARIVAVTDAGGGVRNDEGPDVGGLDVEGLVSAVDKHGSVAAYRGDHDSISNEELFALQVDVLMPAALGGQITGRNAERVRARFVVEGANGPVTPVADRILSKNGIVVVPDILANAGGVTASYFEWVQNAQSFRWEAGRVKAELGRTMDRAVDAVMAEARDREIDLRTAAYAVAVEKVARAAALRGL